ncbi:MAG: hypothetical protein KF694_19195 [Mesorhizobium sp.]|nr:hypothetical protein [Mesorhizobium sp.]
MSDEPESLILQMLRQMRAEIGDMRTDVTDMRSVMTTKDDLKKELAGVRSDMHSLRADVASDLLVMRKETSDQIAGLRRAVVEYHTSVIGHGILISELEARMRRVEQHLDLPALDLR